MMDFYSKATFSSSPDGTVAVSAPAFIQPGDRATFYVDQKTRQAGPLHLHHHAGG